MGKYKDIFFRTFFDGRQSSSDGENNDLARRAWTFQEIQLSPRLIRLRKDSILWECLLSEHTPFQQERSLEDQDLSLNRLLCHLETRPEMATKAHDIWHGLVAEYTNRQLTFSTDKMAAFAAIAERFGDLFQIKDEFCMGFWHRWLLDDLEWHRIQCKPSTRIPRCRSLSCPTPSWSWASVDTQIKLERLGAWKGAEVDSVARIINIDVAHSSPFLGLALRAHITIEAPFFEVEACPRKHREDTVPGKSMKYHTALQVRMSNPPQLHVKGQPIYLCDFIHFMTSVFDVDQESPEAGEEPDQENKYTIAIFSVSSPYAFTGLWLRKAEGWPLRYRRVGVCHMTRRSSMDALRHSSRLLDGNFVWTTSQMVAPIRKGRIVITQCQKTEQQQAQAEADKQQEREYWENEPAREREGRQRLREVLSSVPRGSFVLE